MKYLIACLIASTTVILVGFQNQNIQAAPCGNDILSKFGCAIDPYNPEENGGKTQQADPTKLIPGSKEFVEKAWGEAGASAYQGAATTTRGRNGSSQGLDEFQKRYLRPHFGNLVDQVAVIYNARMMDQWSAFGKNINLSGVDTAAQTYCNRIYIRDSYKPNDTKQLVTLSHEMTHSKQCERERVTFAMSTNT